MQQLLLNARYLDRPITGVDRVAHEMANALEAHPDFTANFEMNAQRPPTGATSQIVRHCQSLFWEQTSLAAHSPQSFLFSPCNTGPILRRNHIVFMHDTQVFSHPESYSRMFRVKYKGLLPLLGRYSACILAPSEHTKSQLQRFKIAPPHKIWVVPNGADHILRRRPDPSVLIRNELKPGHFFLVLGSLAKHKNLEMLVRAAEARPRRDIPLVIAGGMDQAVFSHFQMPRSPSIKPIGRVTDAELRALYENATALVFPSLTEGFGLPPAEAMFCGCPTISTTAGAVPEVCGTATYSVDPQDGAGWTSAMTLLGNSPQHRQNLSQYGLRQVQKFTWRAAANRLLDVLNHLTSGDGLKASRRTIGQIGA